MGDEAGEGRTAVLLMGYGSPRAPKDLPGFLREVLGGREPPAAMVQEYHRRYDLIGWSPQPRVTESLRGKLERRLQARDPHAQVLLATKHWDPHIADALPEAVAGGARRIVAIPLSPFASPWVLRPYEQAIAEGKKRAKAPVDVELRAGWHRSTPLARAWAGALERTLAKVPAGAFTFLTAHSLPKRQEEARDPYPHLVQETAGRVAKAARLERWEFTYQSAGNTTEPWLGPDVTERMVHQSELGHRDQLVAPIGFVFDHLETLYDLDVVVRGFAEEHGIRYHRVPLPNDEDLLVDALEEVATAPVWNGGA